MILQGSVVILLAYLFKSLRASIVRIGNFSFLVFSTVGAHELNLQTRSLESSGNNPFTIVLEKKEVDS